MRNRERQLGPITSYRVKEVMVQVLGTPWGVDVETTRNGKSYVERLGGHERTAGSLQFAEASIDR